MKFTYNVAKETTIETNSLKEIVEKFVEEGIGTLEIAIEEISFSFTIENKWDEVNIQYFDDWEGVTDWTSYTDYQKSIKDYIESEYTKEQIESIKTIQF